MTNSTGQGPSRGRLLALCAGGGALFGAFFALCWSYIAPLSLPGLIAIALFVGAPWGLIMFVAFSVLLRFRLVGRGATSDPALRVSQFQLWLAVVGMVFFALLFAHCLWGEGRTHTLPHWMAVTFAVVHALFFLMQLSVVVWYVVERVRQRRTRGGASRP